jgi:TRAP-type C4-dicarboxylate transport system permease small subunit
MKADSSLRRGLIAVKKTIDCTTDLAGYAGTIALFLSMAVITYEVLARYLFRWPTVWEIEAAIFLVIFTTFVGSASALKHDAHIRMDMFTERLKPAVRRRVSLATSILALLFCAVACVKGSQMWWEAFRLGWKSDSLWAPPLAIPYAFLPAGFLLLCLQYVVKIIAEVQSPGPEGGRE